MWDLLTFIRLTSRKKQQGKLLNAVITFKAYDGAAAAGRLLVCCRSAALSVCDCVEACYSVCSKSTCTSKIVYSSTS